MKKPSEGAPLTDVTIVTIFRFARHRRREVEPKRSLGMRESSRDDALPPRRVTGGAVLAGADARLLAQLGATDCRQ
jgi:hypothetical protein